MKKIVGIFNTEEKAIRAIEGLKAQGYMENEISVITKNTDTYEVIKMRTGMDVEEGMEDASGAVAGATVGGAIGGIGGLLLGLGALAIPGVGPIIAAGPIAATLVGALAGGAVGGLAGALVDYGIPEDEAKDYEKRVNQGDIMILVDDPDDNRREAVYDNFKQQESYNNTYNRYDALVDERGYSEVIETARSYDDQNPTVDTHPLNLEDKGYDNHEK